MLRVLCLLAENVDESSYSYVHHDYYKEKFKILVHIVFKHYIFVFD